MRVTCERGKKGEEKIVGFVVGRDEPSFERACVCEPRLGTGRVYCQKGPLCEKNERIEPVSPLPFWRPRLLR